MLVTTYLRCKLHNIREILKKKRRGKFFYYFKKNRPYGCVNKEVFYAKTCI